MNDKPMMQFKLSIPDSDALREMIQRDYVAAVAEAKRIEANGTSTGGSRDRTNELQRLFMRVERLAEIFSVTLPKG